MTQPNPPFSEARHRATRAFAVALRNEGIERVLDLGFDPSTFVPALRASGYEGGVYTGAPTPDELTRALAGAWTDPRWVVWRQAMASSPGTTVPSVSGLASNTLARRIGGVRVDTSTLTPDVLEPLLRELPELGVLLVESASDSVAQSRDLWKLDAWLVERHRFERVSIQVEPDASTARGSHRLLAVYRRAPTPTWESKRLGTLGDLDLVTSLGGSVRRELPDGSDFGPTWQEQCFASHRKVGKRVVSVSEVPPANRDIEWHATAARPSIVDILTAIDASGRGGLLVNGDIVLTDALPEVLAQLDPQTFHYANRIEVTVEPEAPTRTVPKEAYEHGYDLFVVPHALARAIVAGAELPSVFRMGEPWWDYALPMVARSLGFPVKRLSVAPPLALHFSHPARYADEVWLANGKRYFEMLRALEAKRPGRFGYLLSQIELGRKSDWDDKKFLYYVGGMTLRFLM
ncbi:MAG: hypothetical protein FJ096_03010 [Deltaproteobacteria bacterium]|nr:hypothetical protein [Deltaproteobacteria bacterium]